MTPSHAHAWRRLAQLLLLAPVLLTAGPATGMSGGGGLSVVAYDRAATPATAATAPAAARHGDRLERERELRVQLADNDVSAIIGNLREDNDGLRADNDYLREQVVILSQDVQMHAELKPALENLQQQVREAGFEHHHALSSLSHEKEQLASEATEALSALRNELEMRAQRYEEDTVRAEARTRQLEDQLAELKENLAEARSLIITAEEAAKAYSTHNTLLENDIASSGRRIAEQEAWVDVLRVVHGARDWVGSLL